NIGAPPRQRGRARRANRRSSERGHQPILCRLIRIDRALPQRPDCRPLTLPGEATISAELAARLSPPLAFYDIGPHDDEWANRPPAERPQPCPILLPHARRPPRTPGPPT